MFPTSRPRPRSTRGKCPLAMDSHGKPDSWRLDSIDPYRSWSSAEFIGARLPERGGLPLDRPRYSKHVKRKAGALN